MDDPAKQIYEVVKRWQRTLGRFEYDLTGAVPVGRLAESEPITRTVLYWKPPKFRVDSFFNRDGSLASQDFYDGSARFDCDPTIEACRRLSEYEAGKRPAPYFIGDLLRPRKLLSRLRKYQEAGILEMIEEASTEESHIGFRVQDEAMTSEIVYSEVTGAVVRIDWATKSHEGHVTLVSSDPEVLDSDFELPYPVVRHWQWVALAKSVHPSHESQHRRRQLSDSEIDGGHASEPQS